MLVPKEMEGKEAVKLSAGGENYPEPLVKIQRECCSQTVVLHLAAIRSLAVTPLWRQRGSETCEASLKPSVEASRWLEKVVTVRIDWMC